MRNVLITGASSGIGRECALRLARMGLTVFAGVRCPSEGERLHREGGGRVHPLRLDVTSAEDIAAAARHVAQATQGRGLDALVNNAGIAVACPLEFLPLDEFQRQLEVNVTGPFRVTRQFLPALRRARELGSPARIVMVSSGAAGRVVPMLGPYSASKSALEAMTHALRMELREAGIQVALVEPGNVRTPLWQKSLEAYDARFQSMPAWARTAYHGMYRQVRHLAVRSSRTGGSAASVARVICHAVTAPRARARYRLGRAHLLGPLLGLLPLALVDRLLFSWLDL